jgi:predicted metal-dependent peptidase
LYTDLAPEEKVTKARIHIQNHHPFFAYLMCYMKFHAKKEDKLDGVHTMCVDADGNLYYSRPFVDTLTFRELVGTILHEIFHIAFLHLLRLGFRHITAWNVATDLIINALILEMGESLPKCGLLPTRNEFSLTDPATGKTVTIKNLSKKKAEVVYDELPISIKEGGGSGQGGEGHTGNGIGGEGPTGWDQHVYSDKQEEGTTEHKIKEGDWVKRIAEAVVSAKQVGKLPAGLERLVDDLIDNDIDWRTVLRRCLTDAIPQDFTWLNRSRRSVSTGFYLPGTLREGVDVGFVFDLSGSIGQSEFNDFVGKTIGLSSQFRGAVNGFVISHDTEPYDEGRIHNASPEKLKQKLNSLRGGGGTSHVSTMEYIRENYPDTRAVIFFTDGYSDLQSIDFSKYPFDKIFVMSKMHNDSWSANKMCRVIKTTKE